MTRIYNNDERDWGLMNFKVYIYTYILILIFDTCSFEIDKNIYDGLIVQLIV